jgi:hypothetical protein
VPHGKRNNWFVHAQVKCTLATCNRDEVPARRATQKSMPPAGTSSAATLPVRKDPAAMPANYDAVGLLGLRLNVKEVKAPLQRQRLRVTGPGGS